MTGFGRWLENEEKDFIRSRETWQGLPLAFFEIAEQAIAGRCTWKDYRRKRIPMNVPRESLPVNRTEALVNVGAPQFHHVISNGIYEIAMTAVYVRIFCGNFVEQCSQMLPTWQSAWCMMLRRFRQATRLLTRSGFVQSAFGTTTAALITQALPREILFPLSALASGKAEFGSGLAAIDNASIVFTEFLECAQLLGDEVLEHGDRRVAHAQFHGDAANWLAKKGILHRFSVLLFALKHGPVPIAQPEVVEIGVDHADVSVRLLEAHPELKWLGVDLYPDVDTKGPEKGGWILSHARAAVGPWLGSRAQLLVGHSDTAALSWRGPSFDLAFVDADHSEIAAIKDIAAWSPLVRSGGVLAGHDYAKIWPGVVEAAHASLPPNVTLHLAPDMVFWWYQPHNTEQSLRGWRKKTLKCFLWIISYKNGFYEDLQESSHGESLRSWSIIWNWWT